MKIFVPNKRVSPSESASQLAKMKNLMNQGTIKYHLLTTLLVTI